MSLSNHRPTAFICLRCENKALSRLDSESEEIEFFECPSCMRQYALKQGGALTYRWLHPISLALYGFAFSSRSAEILATETADWLQSKRTASEAADIAREIEIELESPTQSVKDIIGTPKTESECRAFLARVVSIMKRGSSS
jgi:transposase-like protein